MNKAPSLGVAFSGKKYTNSEMRNIVSEIRDEIWLFLRQEQPKIIKHQSDIFFQDLEKALEIFNTNHPNLAPNQNKIVSIKSYSQQRIELQSKRSPSQPEQSGILKKQPVHASECQHTVVDNRTLALMNTYTGSRTTRRSPEAVLKLIDEFGSAWEKATDHKPRRISGHKTPFIEAAKIFLANAGISRPEIFLRQFLTRLENETTSINL